MARLQPLEEHEWSDEIRAAIAIVPGDGTRYATHRTSPFQVPCTLGHNRALVGPIVAWSSNFALEGTLDRRLSELLTLRTAWNCKSDFEWGHHAEYAENFGLTREEVERVPAGPEAPGWSEEQALLLRVSDELSTVSTITDSTWAALADRFTAADLVEIVLTVGQYTMLSMLMNSLEMDMDRGVRRLPVADRAKMAGP